MGISQLATMQVYSEIIFSVVVFALMTRALSQLDFTECGGDPIREVSIDDCDETPCPMKINGSYNIHVQLEFINPQVDNAQIQVGIFQYGAYFNQTAVCQNPCVFSCPLTTTVIGPQFHIIFDVWRRMVPLTSILQINATYFNGNHAIAGFCAMVDIILSKN